MEIFLAVVVVLIIAGIIALLPIKKKQQALDDEPVVPPTVLQQRTQSSSQDIFNELAHSDSKPEADPIEKVDRLINDNRHDEAVNELKRLLLSNPKNSVAILKLLQVYVLTNNFSAFDKVYQKLKESGDTKTLEQAENYRLLLDDAMPKSAAVVAQDTKIDTLEFDIGTSQPSHHDVAVTPSTAVQAPESLGDFEDFNFDPFDDSDSNNKTPEPAPTPSAPADDGAFDLNFDTPLSDNDFGLETSLITPEPTLDLGGDLSFDTPSTNTTNELDAGFDLDDFGLDSTPAPEFVSTPTSSTSATDSFDFDFNLDASLDTTPSNELETGLDASLDASLDMGLDTSLDTSLDMGLDTALDVGLDSTPTAKVSEPSLDEFVLDDFDLTPSAPQETTKPADTTLDFGGLELDGFDVSEPAKATSPAKADTPSNDFSLDSADFGLESNDFGLELGGLDNKADDLGVSLDVPASTKQDEFSLDGFDLDISTPSTEPTPAPATPSADKSFDLGDLSFETPALAIAKTEPAVENSGAFDFDIGDLSGSTTPDVTPTTKAETSVEDFGFEMPSTTPKAEPVAPSVSISPVSTPKAEPTTGFDFLSTPSTTPASAPTSSFDLSELAVPAVSTPAFDSSATAGLDATGITLELAQQYVALGEYDSAKHLLEEVIATGNSEQSRTASNLLKRLG